MPLFKNKGALNLDRLTVEVVGRKDEAERLSNILKGTEQGYLPKVISVFGPPGSGKTLVTRRVCGDYEKESGGIFKSIYVNLGEAKTVFSAANSILTAVGGTPKSSRVGLDGVMNDFWQKVRDQGQAGMKFLLVGLDEADRLFLDIRGDPSGLLYRLVRSENRLEGSGVRLSLLVISNMLVWDYWELDGRVKSSMGTEEIFFSPYSKAELKQILLNRSNEAFASGVVKEDVIDRLVDYTANQSKDVRRMVDLLRISGEIAEANAEKRIEEKHCDQGVKRIEVDYFETLLNRLPDVQVRLLYILAWFKEIENSPIVTTSQIFQKYQEITSDKGSLSYRRVADILKEIEVMNLIDSRTVSKGRVGYGREVWLKIPTEPILDHVKPDWREIKELKRGIEEVKKDLRMKK